LFISHNLNVVAHISDRVAVMYLGKIIEMAPARILYQDPLHPYTLALLSAVPVPDPSLKRQEIILQGEVPSPINPPSGCRFHPRCSFREKECQAFEPPLKEIHPAHYVACIAPRIP
jgi:peptide/nickel transport system ATP-binding protein